jgi:hypothetical protein
MGEKTYRYKATCPSGAVLRGAGYATPELAIMECEKYITNNPCGYGTFYISILDNGTPNQDVAACTFEKTYHPDPTGQTGGFTTTNESSSTGASGRGGGAAGDPGPGETVDKDVIAGIAAQLPAGFPWELVIIGIIIIIAIIGAVVMMKKGGG